jgi:hypothetical protein
MATKPTDGHMDWITDNDPDKYIAPSAGKRLQGWTQQEKPPFQYFNWAWRLVDRWLKYFEQQTDEIAAAVITRVGADEAVSGASQVTLTGLEAGARYKLEFELQWDSPPYNDNLALRLGGSSGIDTGSNYFWRNDYFYSTPTYTNELNGGDHVFIDSTFDYQPNNNIGTIEFAVHTTDPTNASGMFRSSQSQYHSWRAGMFEYAGAQAVDRVQLFTENGSLVSGAVRLFKSN